MWGVFRPVGVVLSGFLCVLLNFGRFWENDSLFSKAEFEMILFCGQENYDILLCGKNSVVIENKGGA